MKTTVITHSGDYDGIFCREIARKFLPDAVLIGWDFTDPKITIQPSDGLVYVMDLPYKAVLSQNSNIERLVWIDHHKSAIEAAEAEFDNTKHQKYCIDGVAACRLAWQWFTREQDGGRDGFGVPYDLPRKQHFIDRVVGEPLAVRLAGEYDIYDEWRPEWADIKSFQFGLDSEYSLRWDLLLSTDAGGESYAKHLLVNGAVAMQCYAKRDADIMRSRSFKVQWEGLTFLALNTARCNSNTFAELDKPETGHDALLAFYYNGRQWTVSLYHASHLKDIDLSQIAVKHGGGGHRGACGFTCAKPPFIPSL